MTTSSITVLQDDPPYAEAGPLPVKRGEIGYLETPENTQQAQSPRTNGPVLPSRHPADRDPLPSPTHSVALTPAAVAVPTFPRTSTPDANSPKATPNRWKKVIFAGFQLGTFTLFMVQLLLFGATIASWTLLINHFSKESLSLSQALLFVHAAFIALLISQFVLIERRIFRLRAERYSYVHPGEVLPTSRRFLGADATVIAFSPWNRLPLPTYAAAIAQSGAGTGDVDDHLIAAPPPPAYGNTRGSRMLMTGYLRDSLRAQRPASVHTQMSEQQDGRERPLSYVGVDEQRETMEDADRAARLVEAMDRLECAGQST